MSTNPETIKRQRQGSLPAAGAGKVSAARARFAQISAKNKEIKISAPRQLTGMNQVQTHPELALLKNLPDPTEDLPPAHLMGPMPTSTKKKGKGKSKSTSRKKSSDMAPPASIPTASAKSNKSAKSNESMPAPLSPPQKPVEPAKPKKPSIAVVPIQQLTVGSRKESINLMNKDLDQLEAQIAALNDELGLSIDEDGNEVLVPINAFGDDSDEESSSDEGETETETEIS